MKRRCRVIFVVFSLPLAAVSGSPILDNFTARPGFSQASVSGDFGVDKEFMITDRSWTAVRVVTGPVATPGHVFHLNEVQIYIAGIQDPYDGDSWGLKLQVRENGFGPSADPEVDLPNAASGAVLGQLSTNAVAYFNRDFNPQYAVFGSGGTLTNNSTFVFTPSTPIELQPNTIYWFSATSDEPGDRIRWKAATANGEKYLGFSSTGGWSLGAQTSDYTVGEAEYWDEPLPPGSFDMPLLIAIHASEGASNQTTSTFSNTQAISLPAGEPDTTMGPASSYPSTITVGGITGDVTKVSIKLNDLAHSYPSDLDLLLVGPDGSTCMLMSDVSDGSAVSGVDLVLDSSVNPLLPSGELKTGIYQPTNNDTDDEFDLPAPAGPYGTSLTVYNSPAAVNGVWSLYAMDAAEGDSGMLAGGWEISITSVSPSGSSPPEIAVSGNGMEIEDGDSTPDLSDHTDFGVAATDGGSAARTFTISNNGTDPLNLTGTPRVEIGGLHAEDFTITQLPQASVGQGGSTTFIVRFDPGGNGVRTATLSIASDDADENPFNFSIQGTGQPASEIFDAAMLAGGLMGSDAEAGAMPFGDGVPNLLKYAFQMDLGGPDANTQPPGGPPGGLPAIQIGSTSGSDLIFRFEYVRRIRSGLVYTPMKTESLEAGTWTQLSAAPTISPVDGEWERVVYEEMVDPGTAPRCFGRVQVTLP